MSDLFLIDSDGYGFGASLYAEHYQYDEADIKHAGDPGSWGPGLQLNAGVAGMGDTIKISMAGVARTGIDITQGAQADNGFGSFGLRSSITLHSEDLWLGGQVAMEAGYRVNSSATDHPYLGAEISPGGLYIGPVIGVQINPVNFIERLAFNEKVDLWDSSSVYLGLRTWM